MGHNIAKPVANLNLNPNIEIYTPTQDPDPKLKPDLETDFEPHDPSQITAFRRAFVRSQAAQLRHDNPYGLFTERIEEHNRMSGGGSGSIPSGGLSWQREKISNIKWWIDKVEMADGGYSMDSNWRVMAWVETIGGKDGVRGWAKVMKKMGLIASEEEGSDDCAILEGDDASKSLREKYLNGYAAKRYGDVAKLLRGDKMGGDKTEGVDQKATEADEKNFGCGRQWCSDILSRDFEEIWN